MFQRKLGIVIGTNEYFDSKIRNLQYAEKDAKDVKDTLLNPDICGFESVVECINKHSNDTFIEIEELFYQAEYNDLLLVYYSGHGELDSQNDLCLLFSNTRMDRLISTSLNYSMIKKCINSSSCKTIIVILDCCYSGAAGIKGNNLEEILSKSSGSGTFILSASSEFDVSKEEDKLKNGIFTHYLIKGICGEAESDINGNISLSNLYKYVYKKTTKIHSQTPYLKVESEGEIIIGKSLSKIKENGFERKNNGNLTFITDKNLVKINDYEGLKEIPMGTLQAVFSPREIEALFAQAKYEKPIRQYLYRARKRYGRFEELFGISLEL